MNREEFLDDAENFFRLANYEIDAMYRHPTMSPFKEPETMDDSADLLVQIECGFERLGYGKNHPRIVAFIKAHSKRDGRKYRRWRDLPIEDLKGLLGKIENQLKEKIA